MKLLPLFASATLAALAGVGCISTHETVYRTEERLKVEFENESAARIFYETLAQHAHDRTSEHRTKVEIPIVFSHERTEKDSGNSRFNEAVRRCDTNQDGRITETEARIYSEHPDR